MPKVFNTTLESVRQIPGPRKTSTYSPILYHDAMTHLEDRSKELMPEHIVYSARYGVSRHGQNFFGCIILATKNGEHRGALAVRMAYNGDYALTLASGVYLPTYDTVTLSPESFISLSLRSQDIQPKFEEAVDRTIYAFKGHFAQVRRQFSLFRPIKFTRDSCYGILGVLRGRDILTSTQANEAFKQLEKYEPRYVSLYTLFNCAQAGIFKHNKAGDLPERLVQLYKFVSKNITKDYAL